VVAALFALGDWPFKTERARELVSDVDKSAQEQSDAVSERWTERLDRAGLWNSVLPWTPELIAQRAALQPGLVLRKSELPTTILALRAVTAEFADDWDEFCIVIPGSIDWYPVGPSDVVKLADRLEALR
jgi:hypothetical protein